MRITGGSLRGRRLRVPKTGVRPTQDKVREALFSSLGERVPGCCFLDLFAGTGAVGLEAWSRGAEHVSWVEHDRVICAVLRDNVSTLCGASESGAEIIQSDVAGLVSRGSNLPAADFVYADPPYARGEEPQELIKALKLVRANDMLLPDGLFVAELAADCSLDGVSGWSLVRDRTYGGTRLGMWRLSTEE